MSSARLSGLLEAKGPKSPFKYFQKVRRSRLLSGFKVYALSKLSAVAKNRPPQPALGIVGPSSFQRQSSKIVPAPRANKSSQGITYQRRQGRFLSNRHERSFKNLGPRTRLGLGLGIMAWGIAGLYFSDMAEESLGLTPTAEDKAKLEQYIPKVSVVDNRGEKRNS